MFFFTALERRGDKVNPGAARLQLNTSMRDVTFFNTFSLNLFFGHISTFSNIGKEATGPIKKASFEPFYVLMAFLFAQF